MLPDMSEVLDEWAVTVQLKTITQHTIDFQRADLVSVADIQAVVQPANKEKLNPDSIDWSLRYVQIHSVEHLSVGQFIEHEGIDYKIIEDGNYLAYGYCEAIGEQTKQSLITATHLLTYTAGTGGAIVGSALQVVADGADGSAVTATPSTGYAFVQWNDGVLTTARTDLDVLAAITVSAEFEMMT